MAEGYRRYHDHLMKKHITIYDLIPRPYDQVRVFWDRLIEWAKQKDIVTIKGPARVTETVHGTSVVFEPRFPWDHPFRVSVSARIVNVRPGYVGDEMPTLGGIALDGLDADGNEKPEPRLDLGKEAAPGEDGRSYLCLAMRYDVARRQSLEDEEDWLTIVHLSDLDAARAEAGPAIAYEPLAIFYWEGSQIARAAQIVHHNLVHSFLPGEGEGTGKHFFSAV